MKLIRDERVLTLLVCAVLSGTVNAEFRTLDGTGNNLTNTQWGSTDQMLRRLTTPDYANSVDEPRGGLLNSTLPSAREVSNAVADQSGSIPNAKQASDWLWQWGQFLDHDIDHTPTNSAEPFNVEVPANDPVFTNDISLKRSVFATDNQGVRQQTNNITAFIDGSAVYGDDPASGGRSEFLRRNDGSGKLKTQVLSGEELLPYNRATNPFDNANENHSLSPDQLFLAGDVRANEQIGLTAAHTLFVREHNRIATDLKSRLDGGEPVLVDKYNNSGLSVGDFIYESSRKLVGAQMQKITYEEFLPMLLGDDAVDPNSYGYDANVNPGVSNEFAHAAYRVGHTMLSPDIKLANAQGQATGSMALAASFFNPTHVANNGVDEILWGLTAGTAQAIDNKVVDAVRNFLFAFPPNSGSGFDLASLNMQRGRDHGIASLNDVRDELGLGRHGSFLDMTGGDQALADAFASVYADVDDVDLWAGGLAEPQAGNGMLGLTFKTIILEQFTALMNGDRFFYTDAGILDHLRLLDPNFDSTMLSTIIMRNTGTPDMRQNVFVVPEPTTIVLTALGGIALLRRRTRR